MKSTEFFGHFIEKGIEPVMSMALRKRQMNESGKALIRILCTEKPWRKRDPDEMWLAPAQYADGVDTIFGMTINTKTAIGTYEIERGQEGLFESHASRYDEKTGKTETYLGFRASACEDTFTSGFLGQLALFSDDDWNALISSDYDDDDD